jgi:chromosome partitioning protein
MPMNKIIAIANVKGGVGKTTVTANLSAALAERGRQVLAIDLDPQASLTLSLGICPDPLAKTIGDALSSTAAPLNSLIVHTREHFDLAPARHDLRAVERELEGGRIRILALQKALEPIRKDYDFILLDCPANAGILTGNALAAADELIIPFPADHLALQALHWFIQIVREMQSKVTPQLHIAGLFLAIYDPRLRHGIEVVAEVQARYAVDIPFFSATVRQAVAIKQASRAGQTIIQFAPKSQAAEAYRKLAAEIEDGIKEPLTGDAYAAVRQGRAALAAQDRDHAFFLFCHATQLNPQLADAWIGRAQSASEWEESVRCYAQALLQDPPQQQAANALEALLNDRVPNAAGADSTELMALAHYLIANGFKEYAEKLYARVTELDDSLVEAWLGWARTASSSLQAARSFKRARELAPEDVQVSAELASAEQRLKAEASTLIAEATELMRVGSKEQAFARFSQATETDPSNEYAWIGCARTSEDLDVALEFVQQALQINPSNAEARELHSWLWKPERDWSELMRQPSYWSIALAALVILLSLGMLAHFLLHWV